MLTQFQSLSGSILCQQKHTQVTGASDVMSENNMGEVINVRKVQPNPNPTTTYQPRGPKKFWHPETMAKVIFMSDAIFFLSCTSFLPGYLVCLE